MNFYRLASIALVLSLTACLGDSGGSAPATPNPNATYSVGGTVTGLSAGASVTLVNYTEGNGNAGGSSSVTVSTNGAFTFPGTLLGGAGYAVAINAQPPLGKTPVAEICAGSNGTGTIGSANVTNVSVVCAPISGPTSGAYAYVANHGFGGISQYIIGSGGELAPLPTSTVASSNPEFITVDPTNHYAFVGETGYSVDIAQYAIVPGGDLIPITTVPVTGLAPQSIAVDPSSRYVYVADGDRVLQFTIGAGGALTPMATPSVAALAGGQAGHSIAVDPTGQYVYVAGADNVLQFTIGAGGALTPMATASVAAGTGPNAVAIDPSGHYVYVVNGNYDQNAINYGAAPVPGSISQYIIGAGGALTPMGTPSVATGIESFAISVDPTGHYVYVTNGATAPNSNGSTFGTVSQYTIGADGSLTPMTTPSVTAIDPACVAVDPTGHYVYAGDYNWPSQLEQYSIGTGGALTSLNPGEVVPFNGLEPVSIATTH